VIRTIHHLDLVVTSLERSLPFYQGLLGWWDLIEIEGERGERVVYIGPPGIKGSEALIGLRERRAGDDHFDRYAIGVHHVAFTASTREEVDERAVWLREAGATFESPPKEYDYVPGYYAAFFYDPDGIKLELVYVPEES
jgi:glyoxylase I family protein